MTPLPTTRNQYFALFSSCVFVYVLYEWLFTITRVSFLAPAPLAIQIRTLLVVAAILGIPGVFFFAFFAAVRRIGFPMLAEHLERIATTLCILTCVTVVLDTIVYSLTRQGLGSLTGWLVLPPLIVVIVLGYDIWQRIPPKPATSLHRLTYRGFILLSALGTCIPFLFGSHSDALPAQCNQTGAQPNVIILSGDGISADRMSLYGYARDTTPYLRQLAQSSLIFDNAFSNSRRTTSSVSSMLTGRSPITTGVLYYPDFFHGSDAYMHLPGMLRMCGYTTIDVTLRDIVDPYELNLRQGFHIANSRERSLFDLIPPPFDYEKLFLLYIFDKVSDRALHLAGIKRQQQFDRDILALTGERPSEFEKLTPVIEAIRSKKSPIFANIHLMGTHGRRFFPKHQLFSKDQTQSALWMRDFYDDAVLDFDRTAQELVRVLNENAQLESTILIITSDHAINSGFGRIPLLLHYPAASLTGRVEENVQRLDIPVTVLDLLSLPIPIWMEGQSLLAPRAQNRPIFFIDQVLEGATDTPWRNLKSLGVVVCDQLATLEVRTGVVRTGSVAGHNHPCGELINKGYAAEILRAQVSHWR